MVRDPDAKRAITVWLRMVEALRAEGFDDDERAALPARNIPCTAEETAARERFDRELVNALVGLIDAIPGHQPGQVHYAAHQLATLYGVMIGLAHDGPCTCVARRAHDLARSFLAGFGATCKESEHTRIDA